MTVKERIIAIRLSEKIEKNVEYSKSIGLFSVNRKMKNRKMKYQIRKENFSLRREKHEYIRDEKIS